MALPSGLDPGAVFARDFRIVRPLAEGGMGAVYVVEQISTGKERALKVIRSELVLDAKVRERFVQEARVGSRIESDHVVEVVGAGVDDATGTPWLAMELLRGQTLAERVEREGPVPPAELVAIYRQLCHALGAAHRAGLVHRDLKPENIFAATSRRSDAPFTIKVLDFGIAKLRDENRTSAKNSQIIGSPYWMAPEQMKPGSTIVPATDVWALGLIAYCLLTRTFYWRAANAEFASMHAVLAEILIEPLESASTRATSIGLGARVPPGFDAWFARCVAREPSERFADADAALAALETALGTPAEPPRVTAPPSVRSELPPSEALTPPTLAPVPRTRAGDAERDPVLERAATKGGGLRAAAIGVGALLVMGGGALAIARFSARTTTASTTTAPTAPSQPDPRSTNSVDQVVHPTTEPPRDAAPSLGAVPGAAPDADGFHTIAAAVRRQMGAMNGCYEAALATHPGLAGAIRLELVVGSAGRLTSVRATGLDAAPEVGACITALMRQSPLVVDGLPAGGQENFATTLRFTPRSDDASPLAHGDDRARDAPAAGDDAMARARACGSDAHCVVNTLAARARTETELSRLITAYQQLGDRTQATAAMQRYLRSFPQGLRVGRYRAFLGATGT